MLALLLASLGLYGVTSYAVGRRRAELVVRLALGAGPPQLFEVEARDPAMLATGSGVLFAIGVLAGWVPARRAARIDPRMTSGFVLRCL